MINITAEIENMIVHTLKEMTNTNRQMEWNQFKHSGKCTERTFNTQKGDQRNDEYKRLSLLYQGGFITLKMISSVGLHLV